MRQTTFILDKEDFWPTRLVVIFYNLVILFIKFLSLVIEKVALFIFRGNYEPPTEVLKEIEGRHFWRFRWYFRVALESLQKRVYPVFTSAKNYRASPRKLVRNSIFAVIIVFLGYLAVITFAITTGWESGVRVVSILTGSMSPTIAPGSIIVTSKQTDYGVGDVVTYRPANPETGIAMASTLTHRIIEEKQKEGERVFITKGDYNSTPDPYLVTKENILGRVAFDIPFIGYVYASVRTYPGFLGFVVFPAAILVKDQIRYLKNEDDED
jgi:signal peptidase